MMHRALTDLCGICSHANSTLAAFVQWIGIVSIFFWNSLYVCMELIRIIVTSLFLR